MKRSILFASLLGIAIAGYALAQDHPEHPTKKTAQLEVIDATVVGENICVGCSIEKEKGAAAQCSKYGHRHALKVTTATTAGKEIPEMKGWVLHYLETDNGQPMIKEHHGEVLTLKGKIYSEERVFEVLTVEAKKPDHPKEAKKSEHPEHPKK